MSVRDPRIDPKPGDMLRKISHGRLTFETNTYRDRVVDEVEGGLVTYTGDWCCAPTMTLKSWRRWAKGAKVIIHAAK